MDVSSSTQLVNDIASTTAVIGANMWYMLTIIFLISIGLTLLGLFLIYVVRVLSQSGGGR